MTADVVSALVLVARRAAHLSASPSSCPACGGDGDAVLAERADGVVVRHGDAVAKAHADSTDPADHRARLAVASHPLLSGILLPPLPTAAGEVFGRPVTSWPYGAPVDPADPDAAPWEETGTLLARLHSVPLDALSRTPLPAMRGPAKVARALARLRAVSPLVPHPLPGRPAPPAEPATAPRAVRPSAGGQGDAPGHPAAAEPVHRAAATLPPWARGEAPPPPSPRALCHGDLHLGQLVRYPVSGSGGDWLLIDIDDLGPGDPAWDLARPAAWYAAGLLPPAAWERFLGAYRAAGGPAVPAHGDPWPRLDVAARALTVQTAALALVKCAAEHREPDDVERSMLDACARIAAIPAELGAGPPS
ncbi:aminoglycoside phosphotransferase family protein [Streptomyces sp. NBC_01317]|uniref:phosphotransferase n=1 Tax=Streptomyces sp. NBC_01317 TaxID=2903822 RepID=UPI002E0EE907|nr:aminoglycoside phosphotransferase family protein [Streptomyces sp. NBC_01317]